MINELLRTIRIMLGSSPVSLCTAVDANGNGSVHISEYTAALTQALGGCGCLDSGSVSQTLSMASFTLSTAAGPVVFDLFSASVARGFSGSLPITTTHMGQISGFNIDLLYPTQIMASPVCTQNTALIPLPPGFSLQSNEIAPGRLRLILNIDPLVHPAPTFPQGTVMTCAAQIFENAPTGTYTISADRIAVTDATTDYVPASVDNGTIQVVGDSCAVGPPSGRGDLVVLLPVAVLLVARRLRFRFLTAMLAIMVWSSAVAQVQEVPRAASGRWSPDAETLAERSAGVVSDSSQWQWYLSDITRDGLAIQGRFAITGGRFLNAGTFEGRVVVPDGRVEGLFMDDGGARVATLTGTVTRDGLEGKVVTSRGESSTWSWTAPNPTAWRAVAMQLGFAVDQKGP
jgi:hypothetical protein